MSIEVPVVARRSAADGGLRRDEPIRLGVPFPRSAWSGTGALHLIDENEHEDGQQQKTASAVQSRVLDRWSDGSCRWALVDFVASSAAASGQPEARWRLRVQDANAAIATATATAATTGAVPSTSASLAHNEADAVTIDTGVARFRVAKRGSTIFHDVIVDGISIIDAQQTKLTAIDEQGQPAHFEITRVAIEDSGPIRAVVLLEGDLRRADGDGVRLLSVIARLHFVRGHAHVEWHVTVRNPRSAVHDEGLWDLGDGGSVLIKDLSLTLALRDVAGRPFVRCSPEAGRPLADAGELLELYQDSSGGANWRSTNHLNRLHDIPVSFQGYRLRTVRGEQQGLRATPIVTMSDGARTVAVAMRHFWQNCPKAIEAGRDGLVVRLFPKQYADLHEIQGGEQKTHVFAIAFGAGASGGGGADRADRISEPALAWHRSPLRVSLTPEWYAAAEAGPYLTPRAADPNDAYLALVDAAIEGDDTFIHKREVVDQYGWRHFGDVYGDHEGVFHKGPAPLVSHYNNQYDVVAGFGYQFMRSGDWRWWEQMEELAAHVTDIDIYHTDEDKSAYNHGLFWHTFHYIDADTCTHRSYPRKYKNEVKGGGPSSEQNYATGLMLHYFMTGDPLSRDASLGLARFVLNIDDGTKTIFRWVDRGYTGLASASGVLEYQGPGRGSGNSLAALLDGHRLTGERLFLDKAEQIIRRCIHPRDDIAARKLLDAERRWYYNMFLQALGKYLDHKAELNELDARYAYARASLLHYARWMADHEYPYLDKPEILEYPNETWAAQDMRKSQVFKFAARHAENEPERAKFLERSQFFFDYSTRTLSSMKTRTLTRPVVLLLTNGFMHAWFQQANQSNQTTKIIAPKPQNEPLAQYGDPEIFIPQRVRAIKRAKLLAGVGAAAAVVALGALGVWLL
jgi:hypothetical protein